VDPSLALTMTLELPPMTIGLTRPGPGEVLHFSEDPAIEVFVPHVAATARQVQPYVWALDADQAPAYWFPRDCPRVIAWPSVTTSAADRDRFLGVAPRLHAIEYRWLRALQSVELYAYRFAADDFAPFGQPEPHAQVATKPVRPLGAPQPVGSLLDAHEAAGIELRLLSSLWPFWDQLIESSVAYSGIRLRNALPART